MYNDFPDSPRNSVSSSTISNESIPTASDNQTNANTHLASLPPETPRLRPIDSVDNYLLTRSMLRFGLQPNCSVNQYLSRDPHHYDKGNCSRQLNKL